MDYIDPGIKVYVCVLCIIIMECFFFKSLHFGIFVCCVTNCFFTNKTKITQLLVVSMKLRLSFWSESEIKLLNIFHPFECNYRQWPLRIQSFSYSVFLECLGLKNQTKNAICVAVIASKTLGFPLEYHDFLSLAVKLKYVLHKLLKFTQTMCILFYFTNGI